MCKRSRRFARERRRQEQQRQARANNDADLVAFRRQQQAARQYQRSTTTSSARPLQQQQRLNQQAEAAANAALYPRHHVLPFVSPTQSATARTSTTTTSASSSPSTTRNNPQPSAPVDDVSTETRKQQIHQHLYHRKLEHADSAHELCNILAAANDRSNDTNDNDENIIVKTWRSAETSVNKIMTPKPECSICLDGYEANETVCWAKNDDCDHIFHEQCIVEWLKSHTDCPLCRTNLLEYEGMQNASNV